MGAEDHQEDAGDSMPEVDKQEEGKPGTSEGPLDEEPDDCLAEEPRGET